MKISPAILINKKCHSHQWFLASKCEWGLQKLIQRMLPLPQSDWCRAGGNARSRGNEETGLAPDSWGAMTGMNSVSSEAKAMTNLDSILKSRDITLPTKVHLVKAMVFPVVTYGYKNWTIKKVEHQRTDAFELWCSRRLLSPLNCKEIKPFNPKGNQS